MHIRKLLLFLSLLLGTFITSNAQLLDHTQGEILVQFNQGVVPNQWLLQQQNPALNKRAIQIDHCISENMKIWSIRFDWTRINEYDLLAEVQLDKDVVAAQFNHFLDLRSATPNDPQYGEQWFLNNTGQRAGFTPGVDLGMEEAWDITTGGVTPEGDTIVICVIDNGLDLDHSDFQGNIWYNYKEIPNNGLDDDNNGYVDDYRGWHVDRKNDNVDDQNFHGTLTAGIIGAKGNNGIGVTGINWNVKLMIVVGGFGQAIESRIIEAYDYSLTQRRLYNETNGEKGAFVVATNSSWGVSRKFPDEFPLWCAVYDSLGNAGVINIAATDNKDVDVDAEGDMPTSCESDFLITVTNVGGTGAKVADAGFGTTSIDLGAFGDQIFTTGDDNSYTENRGTSYSAPMVTGAVGLLYAANCASLSAIYKESPKDGALKVKDILLRSVDPEPTLDSITVTGGRLNIHNALQLLLDECGDCPPLLQVGTEGLTDTETNIKWLTNELIGRVDFRWRQLGETEWTVEEAVQSPIALDSLIACTSYEYQFKVYCENDTLDFTDRTFIFKTDGCCDPPANFQSTFIGNVSIAFKWDPVLAAQGYTLRYRALGTENWIERFAPSTNRSVPQLTSCTTYEFQVRSNCVGEESDFSQSIILGTFGCGACLDQDYCTPLDLESSRSSSEWIAGVAIDGIDNTSDGQGYSDFTGLMLPDIVQGDTIRLQLTPGYSGFAFDEFFKVWIDYDQDGFFSSLDVAYETPDFVNGALDTSIIIPVDARLGKTRMRVIMKFNSEPSACVSDAGSFFGEVEDYCINIVEAVTTSTENPLARQANLSVFPNPVVDQLNLQINLQTIIDEAQVEIVNLSGQIMQQTTLDNLGIGQHRQVISTQSWQTGVYFIRLKTGIGTLVEKVIKY